MYRKNIPIYSSGLNWARTDQKQTLSEHALCSICGLYNITSLKKPASTWNQYSSGGNYSMNAWLAESRWTFFANWSRYYRDVRPYSKQLWLMCFWTRGLSLQIYFHMTHWYHAMPLRWESWGWSERQPYLMGYGSDLFLVINQQEEQNKFKRRQTPRRLWQIPGLCKTW